MNPLNSRTPEETAHAGHGLLSPETEKRSRRLFWIGMGIFVIATGLISVWVMSQDTPAKMATFQAQLAAAKPYLLIWRLALMSVMIGFYPFWIHKVAEGLAFHPALRQIALNQRWPITLLIILVELLFPQRGLAVLLQGLSGL